MADNFADFFALAVPKYFIHKALHDLGWELDYGPTFLYNRPDKFTNEQYTMMHSVAVFKRIPNFEKLNWTFMGRICKIGNKTYFD